MKKAQIFLLLIRATVPIIDNDNRLAFVVLMSFDTRTDTFYGIIKNNILPLVRTRKRQFLEEKRKWEEEQAKNMYKPISI